MNKNPKEKKRDFVNPIDLISIKSKKIRGIVAISMVLSFIFFITAFMTTLQANFNIMWWILTAIATMVAIACVIFSDEIK